AFLERWAELERSLPLVAVGNGFVASHSGPARAMAASAIDRLTGRARENFTWTDLTGDDGRQARVAARQLRLLGEEDGVYVAGHRSTGSRRYRRQGRFYQVNSEDRLYFLVLEPGRRFSPARDLREP